MTPERIAEIEARANEDCPVCRGGTAYGFRSIPCTVCGGTGKRTYGQDIPDLIAALREAREALAVFANQENWATVYAENINEYAMGYFGPNPREPWKNAKLKEMAHESENDRRVAESRG